MPDAVVALTSWIVRASGLAREMAAGSMTWISSRRAAKEMAPSRVAARREIARGLRQLDRQLRIDVLNCALTARWRSPAAEGEQSRGDGPNAAARRSRIACRYLPSASSTVAHAQDRLDVVPPERTWIFRRR